jgi:hypothetical protein
VANIDPRSTEEIIESVECHGQTITNAIARLRDLMPRIPAKTIASATTLTVKN